MGAMQRNNRTSPSPKPGFDWAVAAVFGLWILAAGYFWHWWLQPGHNIGTGRYIIVSAAIFWLYFLLAYFMLFFLNGTRRRLRPSLQGPMRVAMITTKTPAEPLSVLKETLTAMLAQTTPHDTWLADEDPDDATRAWCAAHGVRISTRKGLSEYHRKEWPRRTRCKEGNLAYFYDQYGYEAYDIVSQLDADHVPQPGYLEAILQGFDDPATGYVSAPSICCSNADRSWAARMRLFAEAPFHGGIQLGYSAGWAPMCIGSHYAVRTRALKQAGGLGPELAEDHSTTMLMNSAGWRGTHAADAIAHGAGPACMADLATQEFQWSRSLTTLLLSYTPRYLKGLPPRLRFQFLLCQLWYPLFALFMALMYLFPIAALLLDIRFAGVTFLGFVLHALPSTVAVILFVYLMRARDTLRPYDAKVLSWERALFPCAQWPWVLLGCGMAIADRLRGGFVDFRVTPKGGGEAPPVPLRVLLPYLLLALGAALPPLFVQDLQQAAGFVVLSLINATVYTVLFTVITVQHLRENRLSPFRWPLASAFQATACMALAAVIAAALGSQGAHSLYALSHGSGVFSPYTPKYIVSGAGLGPPGTVTYQINLEWPGNALFQQKME
ncbi:MULTISPECIES: glycosyltransferase [unclassified Leisingera]|uniref:glycosyltransferase n=2 Tax=Leisingera TaxID=191028 RepID=UPI000307C68A|nr:MULTISPECIES: glycosyltransferase family 2 protein [unclassified Leisingera]